MNLLIVLLLVIIALLLLFLLFQQRGLGAIPERLTRLEAAQERIENQLRSELAFARKETLEQHSENRKELGHALQQFSGEQGRKSEELRIQVSELMNSVSLQLDKITLKTEEKLEQVLRQAKEDSELLRVKMGD